MHLSEKLKEKERKPGRILREKWEESWRRLLGKLGRWSEKERLVRKERRKNRGKQWW